MPFGKKLVAKLGMDEYTHTQRAAWLRVLFIIPAVAFTASVLLYVNGAVFWGPLIPGCIAGLFAYTFQSLTSRVTVNEVSARFHLGLFGPTVLVSEIQSAEVVRNSWIDGWGIKRILSGKHSGWLYNVAGFDAVEIVLKSGRAVRIGTDEPQQLRDAIQRVMPPGQPQSNDATG